MARFARDFVRVGAHIVGGCCGTTPEHIRQIRAALEGAAVEGDRSVALVEEPIGAIRS